MAYTADGRRTTVHTESKWNDKRQGKPEVKREKYFADLYSLTTMSTSTSSPGVRDVGPWLHDQ